MREGRLAPSQGLARWVIATRPSPPSRMIGVLSLLLVFQLIAQFVSPSVAALDPYHEHLIIGGSAQFAPTALGWHQHSIHQAHSHPITGSVLEPLGQDDPQVISSSSNLATELSSYFGMLISGILAPHGGLPTIPLYLLLPLGLTAMALTLRPGLPPPAPPPKPFPS